MKKERPKGGGRRAAENGEARALRLERLQRIQMQAATPAELVAVLHGSDGRSVRTALRAVAHRIAPRELQRVDSPDGTGAAWFQELPSQPGSEAGRMLAPEEAVWLADLLRLLADAASSGSNEAFGRAVGPAVGLESKAAGRPAVTLDDVAKRHGPAMSLIAFLARTVGKAQAVGLAAEVAGTSEGVLWDALSRFPGWTRHIEAAFEEGRRPLLDKLRERVRAAPLQYSEKLRELFEVT